MRTFILPFGLAAALFSPYHAIAQRTGPVAPAAIASAEPAAPLTLEMALARAAAGNFSLSAASREVEANEGAIQQAGVLPNPEIALSMEDFRRQTRTTTGQVNIPLELGGKRSARVNAAERGREVAQAELRVVQSELRANVITAFFDVLIAQERVALATGSAGIAAKGAQAAARRVTAGKISPVEETKARVEQANAELEAAEATAELLSARQALSSLWGEATPSFTTVQGNLDTLPSRPAPDMLLQALDNAPALASNRSELDRRQALIAVERSKRYPDLTVSVGAKRDNDLGRNQVIVGISVPLPLFDRNQGNLHEAIVRADKAQDELQANRVRLSNELRQASSQLSISRASAQTLKTVVLPGAQQAYDAASKGFEAGKFGFLDVLDAQRTLFQARIRYLTVLANTYKSVAAIDRIVGR